MLGTFDNDEELDRPDLNKCPDCRCFFAQDDCPLCGKRCPEEMRAGNRKKVKQKKHKGGSSSGRVTFISWYHSWWFIILMMFFFPLAGIILLITSPHKKSLKIIFAVVAVLYGIVSTFGIGNIISGIINIWDKPVDTTLSREEYIAACETVSPEEFYRSADTYTDEFVSMTLTVKEKLTDYDGYYSNEKYITYYICTDGEGGTYEIMIRDCIQDRAQNFIAGDRITVFGEGAGEATVYDMDYYMHTAPCVNVAYVTVE